MSKFLTRLVITLKTFKCNYLTLMCSLFRYAHDNSLWHCTRYYFINDLLVKHVENVLHKFLALACNSLIRYKRLCIFHRWLLYAQKGIWGLLLSLQVNDVKSEILRSTSTKLYSLIELPQLPNSNVIDCMSIRGDHNLCRGKQVQ